MNSISVTMTCRLILNLHAFDDRHRKHQYRSTTQFTTQVSRHSNWIVRAASDFTLPTDPTFSSNSDASTGTSTYTDTSNIGQGIDISEDGGDFSSDGNIYAIRPPYGSNGVYELHTFDFQSQYSSDKDTEGRLDGDIGSWPRVQRGFGGDRS